MKYDVGLHDINVVTLKETQQMNKVELKTVEC